LEVKSYHSSYAAVKAYAADEDANLIFHDAARPLVSQRIINDVALDKYNAVDVAIQSADTIIAVEGKIIKEPRPNKCEGDKPARF
jgi:2-C-methyl-D-erythritol 4-phosphate cytidylyltransferase